MLVSGMAGCKDTSVLAAAINGIALASITARRKLLLQKHALQVFMAEPVTTPAG